jgi:hypothetical protein
MSLNSASVELTDGIKTLGAVWDEARAGWTDAIAEDFEQRFWIPLQAQTSDAVGAIDRLAVVLAQVRRECT